MYPDKKGLDPFLLTLIQCVIFFAFVFSFGGSHFLSVILLLWAVYLLIRGLRDPNPGGKAVRLVFAGLIAVFLAVIYLF